MSRGLSPYDVGGGLLGIVVSSDWTVCFSSQVGNSMTFFAAKGCSPDSNSQSGSAVSASTVHGLIGQNLQSAESSLSAAGSGYAQIGGGDLGIDVPAHWTVCYATLGSAGVAELYAAKDCTPEAAS